jgi:hypothetical protein
MNAAAVDEYAIALAEIQDGGIDVKNDLAASHDIKMHLIVPVPVYKTMGQILEFRIIDCHRQLVTSVQPHVLFVRVNWNIEDLHPVTSI